jgi:hypothetical protein
MKDKQRDCSIDSFSSDVKNDVSVTAQMNQQVLNIKQQKGKSNHESSISDSKCNKNDGL